MLAAIPSQGLFVAFLLLLLVVSAFFLRMACSICRADMPSWRRALVSVVIVGFLTYLVVDFTSYLVMRTLADIGLQVPPWYRYHHWFREPPGLKFLIVSHAGFLKYGPIVFGLCAAGVLQVIVLQAQVSFRLGALIFLMQWGATLVAGYIAALVLGVGLDVSGWRPEPQPGGAGAQQAKGPDREKQKGRPVVRRPGKKAPDAPVPPQAEPEASPQGLQHDAGATAEASKEQLQQAGKNILAYADSYLDEVKEAAAPVTQRLPEPARAFLDKGGWWGIFAVLLLIVLLWLRSLARRLAAVLWRPRRRKKRRTKKVGLDLKENLKAIGEAYTEEGPRQITVKGMPARLRLVVLSTGGRNSGQLVPEMVDRVLDWIKPGLAEVTTGDYPRVKVWPPFYSLDGFATAFAANVPIPGPDGAPSPWVLVTGQVKMGNAIIQVGLALYVEEATTLRNTKVKSDQWLDVLGVKNTGQPARAYAR